MIASAGMRWIWFRPPPPAADPWGESRPPPTDALGHLRRTFSLEDLPASARCRVTADARYELWVNGVRVGSGPARSDPAVVTYDEYDIAHLLNPGPNVVAALVRHYGRPTLWWRPGKPDGEMGYGSFLFEATIDGRHNETLVTSGPGWKARSAGIWTVEPADAGVKLVPPPTEGPPPLEIVEGASVPWGWTDPSFNDMGWKEAHVMSEASFEPFEPRGAPGLTARTILPVAIVGRGPAAPMHDHPLAAVDADRPGTSCIEEADGERLLEHRWTTYDMGGIVNAHPFLEVSAEPGSVLDLACGEDVTPDGRPVTAPREWAMRVVVAGRDAERHESFEAIGFRYLSIAARSGSASVRLGAIERLAPRPRGAYFRCSDPTLDAIWDAGARSVDLCSTDAFIDCPGREQRAWLGDAYLTGLIRSILDPDRSLAARTLRLHAQGARSDGLLPMVAAGDFTTKRTTIPDSTLLWVAALHAYYQTSGDLDLVAELLPVAERALNWFEGFRSSSGLLEGVPGWIFIDWAQTQRGPNIAALDAFYVWALELFAQLSDLVGNHGSAGRARERAVRTRSAFEAYWDESRGVYVDALGSSTTGRVSQQTNSITIVASCAPRNRWERMLTHITDHRRLRRTLTPGDPGTFAERMSRQWEEPASFDHNEDVVMAQPFFAHFLHRALDLAGRRDEVLSSIRRWRPLVDRGNGCLEEYWDAEPGLGSRCHAWSATPVFDLVTVVLGVRAVEPGMSAVSIEPFLGDLDWAEGAVATPQGFLHVSVERGRDPSVQSPDGIDVLVSESAGRTRP